MLINEKNNEIVNDSITHRVGKLGLINWNLSARTPPSPNGGGVLADNFYFIKI